jgi:hypothetical protein
MRGHAAWDGDVVAGDAQVRGSWAASAKPRRLMAAAGELHE